MKIGLVCPYPLTRGGGVQEVIFALQAGLNKRGHEAIIISQRPAEYKGRNKKGVIFLGSGFDFSSAFQTSAQISGVITTEEIDEVLEREKFDLLHFHQPEQPLLSRQILVRSSSVNVATFHAKVLETIMVRTLLKAVTPYTRSVLDYIDTMTAVSPAASDYIRTLTEEPIVYVPNGIDLKRYHAKRNPDEARDGDIKTILYLGRLEKRKGVKYLLKAYERVCQNNDKVRLVIAGDGPDMQKLQQLVSYWELPRVEFLGYVSETRKVSLLRSADLFVSPALHGESFGIVLLEAMACGLPIVAGDNAGYSHLMQGLGSISLVNVQDSLEFARRIELLLGEPVLRDLWRKWALNYVKQFNYDKVVDQYVAVYERAMIEHNSKTRQNKLKYATFKQT